MQNSQRIVERVVMPLPEGVAVLHPERVLLTGLSNKALDIGALCYLKRDKSSRSRLHHKFDGFKESRINQVRMLIEHCSSILKVGGRRKSTVFRIYQIFLMFMDWCDSNGHYGVLDSVDLARAALSQYTGHIKDSNRRNKISDRYAALRQADAITLLNDYFALHGIYDIRWQVQLIKDRRGNGSRTIAPDDEAKGKVLAWCECFFNAITPAILEGTPYPIQMNVPSYLNWPDNSRWIFPVKYLIKRPSTLIEYVTAAWNFDNGRIHELNELREKFTEFGDSPRKTWMHKNRKYAVMALENSNAINAPIRHEHGIFALQAFFVMFLADTGQNLATIREYPWSDSINSAAMRPGFERQQFRKIKYRATNRIVSFDIGATFQAKFRLFLKLREFLLGGRECPYLFFHVGVERGSAKRQEDVPSSYWREQSLQPLPEDILTNFYERLKQFDPDLPKIMSRNWREAKFNWGAKMKYAPEDIADLMQNGTETARRNYMNGTDYDHRFEMGDFLSQMSKTIIEKGMQTNNIADSCIGQCLEVNAPKAIANTVPVDPDCGTQVGCLFCDKYRVNADEKDAHKLFSCRHCMREMVNLSDSQEDYQRVFGPVLRRIDLVIGEVRNHEPEMIARMEREVDLFGKLEPYWEDKLQKILILTGR